MFERRVRRILIVLGGCAVVVITRLVELQIVRAEEFEERTQRLLSGTPETLPFVRGAIRDRLGAPLVCDEPCWSLCIDYRVLDYRPDRFAEHVRAYSLRQRYAAVAPSSDPVTQRALYESELDAMWRDVSDFAGESRGAILKRAEDIVQRVRRIRELHAARVGFDEPVREERWAHAILTDMDAAMQLAARERFRTLPWVRIQPATRRRYFDAVPFAHLLGRLGPVDADDLQRDPHGDDPFACYEADEWIGKSGVERMADEQLRGRRGELMRDRAGRFSREDVIEAQNGRDVRLTLRADLQHALYRLMEQMTARHPGVSGGCVVVLDVETRDLLACVSFPSYDPQTLRESYPRLRDDTVRLPLVFRAVATSYTPGSILKPLTCLAGLGTARINLSTSEYCSGHLFPDHPEAPASKCWPLEGTNQRMAHGAVDVVAALRGSCNVFMYHVGQRLGASELTQWFDMFGLGRTSGTGLPEEVAGINPTPGWLAARGSAVHAAHARLFSIGQGEVSVTPVQAANLMASYVSGRFQGIRLAASDPPGPAVQIVAEPAHVRAIRRGLYEVVNHPSGTAHKHVHFTDPNYALCGKTGSATVEPRPTMYAVPAVDAEGTEDWYYVPAGSRLDAIARFRNAFPGLEARVDAVQCVQRWPAAMPEHGRHAHAWFAGFLLPRSASGEPQFDRVPRVAFAVLMEFGGSGGRVSGPAAAGVARVLLDILGPDLNPDVPTKDVDLLMDSEAESAFASDTEATLDAHPDDDP